MIRALRPKGILSADAVFDGLAGSDGWIARIW
jgi:hypothetical protein